MAWTFKQIEPQPARGKLIESLWDDPNWIAEEKYDGDRRIAQFCEKVVRFTGRRKSVDGSGFVEKSHNVPHLSGYWFKVPSQERWSIPEHKVPTTLDGTVLDGEIVINPENMPDLQVDGGRSKYVTSIMGSLPEEAVRKQIERGWLRYVVFDCLFYKGDDVRGQDLFRRYSHALRAVKEWGNPFVSIAKQYGETGKDKRKFRDAILKCGGEGVILKNLLHRYGDKNGWVKVKAEWAADVVIMGFKDAKEMSKKVNGDVSMTKYAKAGLIGAIVCGQYKRHRARATQTTLEEVATVSGMDDDLRRRFTKKPASFYGKVIEIAHNGREPTGRFRHPRFKRFRDDKRPQDCVYRENET